MPKPDKLNTSANSDKDRSKDPGAEISLESYDAEEKLRKLVEAYEIRMDEVAEMITRVRHEINNPLTGVLGQAQLLLREELSDKARKRVQIIEQLAVRLRDIVAQLRQVQKVSRN
ncbi:MAG TPA: histidine kinase dimerization/phospho-acceptor domain-containing protein [Pyrinomonadaceae bacterium]|jgi:signal transduction histidine kinase